jgi:Centrosome-associated C terminus
LSPPLGTFKRQKCLRFKNFRYSNSSNVAQTSTSQPNSLQIQNNEDDRRPILRSKSDISDRYWNKVQQQPSEMSVKSRRERYQQTVSESFGSNGSGSAGSSGGKLSKSDSMYELEHFFDQLGLDDEDYQLTIARPRKKHQRSASATVTSTFSDNDSDRSSVVFFSDCSTIDSNRIIAESGPTIQTGQSNPNLYRPSEPPSIVERNARIIKWLCNCKKSQLL